MTIKSNPGKTLSDAKAADYDKWLIAEVQEALDDNSPTIPHETAMKVIQAAIAKKRDARRSQFGKPIRTNHRLLVRIEALLVLQEFINDDQCYPPHYQRYTDPADCR